MKIAALILAVILLAVLFSGCASVPVQRVLDASLPADFKGDAKVVHKNPYFKFTVEATGLSRGDKGWSWIWLTYTRDGFVSTGTIELGLKPAAR